MKTIICKARKNSFNDKPIWIDPIWQILHSNSRYQELPDYIKKRCYEAKFKEIIHRRETFATVEYRDTIYGKRGPFYIDLSLLKILTEKQYLKHKFKEECRLATEQEVKDYHYYPIMYPNKYSYDLFIVEKTYLVETQHNYHLPEIKAGKQVLQSGTDLHYWKMRTDYKNDFTVRLATKEDIDRYEFPGSRLSSSDLQMLREKNIKDETDLTENELLMEGLDSAIEGIREGTSRRYKVVEGMGPMRDFSAAEVKKIREKFGLTQESFAVKMGVLKKTVEEWESGMSSPSGSSIKLLEIFEKQTQFW